MHSCKIKLKEGKANKQSETFEKHQSKYKANTKQTQSKYNTNAKQQQNKYKANTKDTPKIAMRQ